MNLIGQRFTRLLVIKRSVRASRHGNCFWECLCDCGTRKDIKQSSLRTGATRSCGCLQREVAAAASRSRATHGMSGTLTFRTWVAMIQRCTNPRCERWKVYGGRGIRVCKRWTESFAAFLEDMGERPTSKHSIERIDNDGNYEPGNCRWATPLEQARNTRRSRFITFKGKTLTMSEWERLYGLRQGILCGRLQNGWTLERALTQRVVSRSDGPITCQGITLTVAGWSERLGMTPESIRWRLKNWPTEQALTRQRRERRNARKRKRAA